MAEAMREAVSAGRKAFRAGRMARAGLRQRLVAARRSDRVARWATATAPAAVAWQWRPARRRSCTSSPIGRRRPGGRCWMCWLRRCRPRSRSVCQTADCRSQSRFAKRIFPPPSSLCWQSTFACSRKTPVLSCSSTGVWMWRLRATPMVSTYRWIRSALTMCARSHQEWLSPARPTPRRRSPPLRAHARTSSCSARSSKRHRNGGFCSRAGSMACQRRLSSGFRWLRWAASRRRSCRRAYARAPRALRAFAPFWLQPIRALRQLRFLLILPRENKFPDKFARLTRTPRSAQLTDQISDEIRGRVRAERGGLTLDSFSRPDTFLPGCPGPLIRGRGRPSQK